MKPGRPRKLARFLLAPVLLLILISGCGGESAPESSAPIPEPARPAEEFRVRIEVRGWEDESLRPGFVQIDSDCSEGTSDDPPGLGPLDIQVPADWEIGATGMRGARRGEVAVRVGSVQRHLTVRLEEQLPGSSGEDLIGAGAEPVGTVHWAGESRQVYFDGFGYVAAFPAISVPDVADVFAVVVLGGRGSGDLTTLDREAVLMVFETAHLDRCVADSYAAVYRNAEVVFVESR